MNDRTKRVVDGLRSKSENIGRAIVWLVAHGDTIADELNVWADNNGVLTVQGATYDQMCGVCAATGLSVSSQRKFNHTESFCYYTLSPSGVQVDFWEAGIPPTCRIEYDEVEVPACEAHTKKVARIVCEENHV